MENLRAQHHEGLYAACMAQAVSVIGRHLSGFDVNVDTHITQRPNLYDDDTCLWRPSARMMHMVQPRMVQLVFLVGSGKAKGK